MWSASMCVTTSSSNFRSSGGSAWIRACNPSSKDPFVPPSIRIRFGAFSSPYSIQSASPCAAGSMSIRNIAPLHPCHVVPVGGGNERCLRPGRVVDHRAAKRERHPREVDEGHVTQEPLEEPAGLGDEVPVLAERRFRRRRVLAEPRPEP